MVDRSLAYYRLQRVDGLSLPVNLEYGDGECVVTDGDLVLRGDDIFGGDGTISIRLFGRIAGAAKYQELLLEREAFDRLDASYLTFPGGRRHQQGIPPHSVVRHTDGGVEVTALTPDSTRYEGNRILSAHRWCFSASQQPLPDSDAAAG